MIISASRRTDIPAFYSKWFMERVRDGYCQVFNPYNRKQISQISLKPEDVDVIVFWTKNPVPLLPFLPSIDNYGLKYLFHFTITGYGRGMEPHVPDLESSITAYKHLVEHLGSDRVIWRYDPIILSNLTDCNYHIERFNCIAQALKGYTHRVYISLVDHYRKATINFKRMEKLGIKVQLDIQQDILQRLMENIVEIADLNQIELFSCAEIYNLKKYNIWQGKCIDVEYINKVFNLELNIPKDRYQRLECGCAQSKDIGAYATCVHGCVYCYAGTLQTGLKNQEKHHWEADSLIPI